MNFFVSDKVHIAYRVDGPDNAPTIVFVNSLGTNLRMWDPQIALLDALQIERTHICGLSLGGVIALWFAATYPNRVLSAVFANTAARIGTEETWNTRIDAGEA